VQEIPLNDPEFDVDYKVTWQIIATGTSKGAINVKDLTPAVYPQQTDLPGFEAVIAEGKKGSNVYCGTNLTNVAAIKPPSQSTPSRITFCWRSGPCLVPQDQVETACMQYPPYDPGETNPLLRVKNYLQAHRIAPQQPINLCGCAPEIAKFCDPSVPGSCTDGTGALSGLETQATMTSGSNTCRQIVIGGRAMKIGDTCTP
jgi:hypothetical protein